MGAMAWVLVAAFGAVTLAAPRRMAFLLWPVILLYPQNLLYGLLPANVGLDDILILLLGVRILISSDTTRRDRVRPVVALALALWLMQTLAEATGLLRYPDLLPEMVKAALKGGVFIIFAILMAALIRTPRDIERFTTSFLVALTASFVVVILCFMAPSLGQYWEVTKYTLEDRIRLGAGWRSFGPFPGPAAAGLMVCLTVPLWLGVLLHRPQRPLHKNLAFAGIFLALTVLVLCKSRAAITGLGGMFLLMSLLSRRRAWIVVLMVTVVLIGTFVFNTSADVLSAVGSRLDRDTMNVDLATRAYLWKVIITNPSFAIPLFAEGGPALSRRLDVSPHNGYLDVIFTWGLGGIIIFCVLYSRLLKWSRRVARDDPYPLSRALAWGLLWGTVSIAIYAISADPWYITNYRFAIYFLLTIVYLRYRTLHRVRGRSAAPQQAHR